MRYLFNKEQFLFENMDRAKNLYIQKMESFEKLKTLLSKNHGYMGKFTELLFNGNTYEDLENLYNRILELKHLNVKIDIDSFNTAEEIEDYVQEKIDFNKVNRVLKKFPKEQKDIIRKRLNSYIGFPGKDNTVLLLIKLYDKEDTDAFYNKISRYKNWNDLSYAIKTFTKDVNNSKEFIIPLIKSLDHTDLLFDNDNITIARVNDFKDIDKLASDTSWCILQKSHWNTYNGEGKKSNQLIIYNWEDTFSTKFKIGTTIRKEGNSIYIHTSHDILDKGVSSEIVKNILSDNGLSLKDLYKEEVKELSPLETQPLESIKLLKSIKVGDLQIIVNRIEREVSDIKDYNTILRVAKLVNAKKMGDDRKLNFLTKLIKSYLICWKGTDKYIVTEEMFKNKHKEMYDILIKDGPFHFHERLLKRTSLILKDKCLLMLSDDKAYNDNHLETGLGIWSDEAYAKPFNCYCDNDVDSGLRGLGVITLYGLTSWGNSLDISKYISNEKLEKLKNKLIEAAKNISKSDRPIDIIRKRNNQIQDTLNRLGFDVKLSDFIDIKYI
jgi:hypothetical protein